MTDVKTLREQARLNQVELAVKAGLSVGTISRIENGHKPNKGTIMLVAAALGVAPQDITFTKKQAPGE